MNPLAVGRVGALLATIVTLTACPGLVDDNGTTVMLSTSDGTSAELRVVDHTGFLASAQDASQGGSVENLDIEPVPDVSNAIRVSWIASPCHQNPRVTIEGESPQSLEITLDLGPVPEDVVCPGMGLVFGVRLVFRGEV